MLFIVTATVTHVERGIEHDTETVMHPMHPVEADSSSQAEEIVRAHYVGKSDCSGPYGSRYSVADLNAYEYLSKATLKAAD